MSSAAKRHLSARAAATADDSLKEVLVQYPGVISFAGGLPDPALFDLERIAEVSAAAAADRMSWQYCPTEGRLQLRERIAAHMSKLGVKLGPESILITHGSQQALDLLAKTFVDPGDKVLIETPGYIGGIQAMEAYGGELVPAPLDDDGVDPSRLDAEQAKRAKLLYTVSTFQNPTGATLTPERRVALLEAADQYDFLIVEDGAYQHLAYDQEPPRPIASFDQAGRVIYLGSFSKALVPGIRIGWIAAAPEIIERLALLKQATDLATNSFGQRFVELWLERYGLEPPLAAYRAKRDRALEALEKHMPDGVTWNRPGGGFFIWIRLPEGLDTVELLPMAREAGVTFVPGPAFNGPPHTMRFSFSQVDVAEIETGVIRLADFLRKQIAGS